MTMKDNAELSLYNKIRKAVHEQWDPIGVADYVDEMGEYDEYIPYLCKLLEKHPCHEEIFECLWKIETESIGMNGDRKLTEEFADRLYNLVN